MKANLNDKVAFVFGSTQGIGKAIALKLAANGSDIVLNGRQPAAPVELLRQIEDLGAKVGYEQADITRYGEVKSAVDNALGRFGKINILIASGGVTSLDYAPKFFHQTDPGSYVQLAESQWMSRLNCIRAVLDHMMANKKGKIVVVAGDAGRWPTPAEVVSGGCHAAVFMGTKVIAQEVARHGIRVNAVSMPPIPGTAGFDHVIGRSDSLAHVFGKANSKRPLPVTAEDIAEATLFLCADESDAITGQILSVNGGLSFPG